MAKAATSQHARMRTLVERRASPPVRVTNARRRDARHGSSAFLFATALPEAFDKKVQHGDKKQVENGAHDHASEDSRAHRVTSVLSGAAACHQGDNAEDE